MLAFYLEVRHCYATGSRRFQARYSGVGDESDDLTLTIACSEEARDETVLPQLPAVTRSRSLAERLDTKGA